MRTEAFKDWFGDWEKQTRIEKLKNSSIVVNNYKGQYELNRKSAKSYIKDNLRGEYINKDTGEKISISKVGINEVTSHGSQDEAHLKSLISIPDFIEKSIFIQEIKNEKDNNKYDIYRYYVAGVKINGEDYTAKMVVGVKGDSKYYDHRLTEIEKGTLIDNLNGLSNSVAEKQNSLSEIKDTKLVSILQNNSSKVVDENGEPMVVYHGTSADFDVFDKNKIGKNFNASTLGFYFINFPKSEYWSFGVNASEYAEYAGNNPSVMPVFLDIKNPMEIDSEGWETSVIAINKQRSDIERWIKNEDGVISKDSTLDHLDETYIVFKPNQIKSATANVGTFSEDSDDIRYHNVQEHKGINATFNEELAQMREGSLPSGHIFQLGRPNTLLQSAGIPNLPIEMSSTRLEKKSSENYKKKHPFDLDSIENLPQALQTPIAIFNNPNNDGKVLLTELKHNGVNHIVALKVKTEKGRNEVEFKVNSVATVFPKDRIEEIAEWILDKTQGRKAYFNKEKSLAWLSNNGTTLRSKVIQHKGYCKYN